MEEDGQENLCVKGSVAFIGTSIVVVASVANRDDQNWVVDSIVEHTGDKSKRKSLQFKVRWANYGPEYDKWLPYRDLLHNTRLHEYLANNKMKSLIPIGEKI